MLFFSFSLAASMIHSGFILFGLCFGYAGIFAVLGGIFLQKDSAYELKQCQHTAHQYADVTGDGFVRRQASECAF